MANPPRSGTTPGPGATPGPRPKPGTTPRAGAPPGAGPTRGASPSYGGGPTRGASPSPGAGTTPGGPTPNRPGAKAVRAPRKAQRIRWSPQAIHESQAGRWVLTGFVGVVLVLGVTGWYWYLTRPSPPVPSVAVLEPGAPAPVSQPETAAPASVSRAGGAGGQRPSVPSTTPLDLTAKELRDKIMSHAPEPVDQAYAMYYQGREVTWAGHVAHTQWQDRLLRVDLRDDDGMRVIAWCEAGAEPKSGTRATVRGRVTTKLADGFVVERCEVL
jgi:hypothetical protein